MCLKEKQINDNVESKRDIQNKCKYKIDAYEVSLTFKIKHACSEIATRWCLVVAKVATFLLSKKTMLVENDKCLEFTCRYSNHWIQNSVVITQSGTSTWT